MNYITPSETKRRNAPSNCSFIGTFVGAAVSSFLRRKSLWSCLLLLMCFSNGALATSFNVIAPNTPSDFGFDGGSYATGTQQNMTVTTYNGTTISTMLNTPAWEVNITSAPPLQYNVKLGATNTAQVQAGDLLVATFYYRRKDAASGAEANFSCDFQASASPYLQSFNLPLRGRAYPANSAPPNGNPVTASDTIWRHVSIPFTSAATYAPGAALFNFYMGAAGLQTLDIADVSVTDYGPTTVFTNPPPTNPIDSSSFFTADTTSGGVTYGTITTNVAISGLALYTTGTQIQTTVAPPQTWPNAPVTWNLRLDNRLPVATNVGDTLVALFWTKATAVPSGVPYAVAGITATGCVGGSFNLMIDPKAGWREWAIPLKVVTAETAYNTDFYINFGFQLQTVQVAGIQVFDLGQQLGGAGVACTLTNQANDYPGRALSDSWRTTAAANIAKYREGTMTVNVKDGNGNSLSGVTVAASMTAPFFGFGCQTSSTPIIGWDDNGVIDPGTPLIFQLFNHVEMGCYKWTEWEEETATNPAAYCTPSYNAKTLDTIRASGKTGTFDFRGHNLIWPADSLCPTDVASINTASAMTTRIDGHITQMVGDPTVHGYFSDWDAVNEPYDHNDEMQVENGLARHPANAETQAPGSASVTQAQNDALAIAPWLAFTRATDPYPHLFINDWGIETNTNHIDLSHENYEADLLTNLENANADIDGIGFESHFIDSFTGPLVLTNIFNRFATGLASGHSLIENVTEFDENESSGMAQAFPPDIDLYTDYMNDYLTEVFSQPNFDFFDLWSIGDMYTLQNSTEVLLPQGEAWMSLVRNQWWTNTSAASNTSGIATLPNCFLGRYCLTATNGSITKQYYTDLLSTGGSTTNLQLSGSTGTTHVWTYAASRHSNGIESPMQVYSDSTAYNGQYVMAPVGAGNIAPVPSNQLPEMRIDTEATGNVTLWFHVSTANGNEDSFWAQFGGANPGTTVGTADPNDHPTGPYPSDYFYVALNDNATWHWFKVETTTLAAGQNTLYIVHRECGAKLDEVLLTDDPNFTPQ